MVAGEILSTAFLGSVFVHSVLHLLLHECYHKVSPKLFDRVLQNHDVARVFKKSYSTATTMLRKEFDKSGHASKRSKAVFKALEQKASVIAENDVEENTRVAWGPSVFLVDPDQAQYLTDMLFEDLEDVPQELRTMLEERFIPTLVFCFTELGIKRDEKVRAVIAQNIMEEISSNMSLTRTSVEEVKVRLENIEAELQSFAGAEALDSVTMKTLFEEALEPIDGKLDEVVDLQQQILELVRQHSDGGPLSAYLIVSRDQGVLATLPIHGVELTIGRTEGDLRLPDAAVSAVHASIKVGDSSFRLTDESSTNGTFVAGVEVDGVREVNFGTSFDVGPFVLTVLAPDTPGDELPQPRTIKKP